MIGSEKLAQVCDQAALLYDRLILIADDFGLVDMSPVSLRLRAVPGRDSFTLERVEACCLELTRVGLVRPYTAEGKALGAIQKWDQTRWAKKAKLPMPPWGEDHITGGHIALRARAVEASIEPAKPPAKPRTNGQHAPAADDGFALFKGLYPRQEAMAKAAVAWKKLAPDADLVARILAAIEAQQKTGCLVPGRSEAGRDIVPLPASWISQRRWEDQVKSFADVRTASERRNRNNGAHGKPDADAAVERGRRVGLTANPGESTESFLRRVTQAEAEHDRH